MTRYALVLVAACLWALAGCHSHDHGNHSHDGHSHAEDHDHGHDHGHGGHDHDGHDHAHGHEHGHSHGPSEEYVEHLESSERAAWQKPNEVVAALGLKGDETVVDVGAGTGYFSIPLAKALPQGKLIGTDVEQYMVDYLTKRASKEGLENIEATLTRIDSPGIPAGTDLIFICNVLHHIDEREAWLVEARQALAPDGRLALVEFIEGELPVGPPASMKIPHGELLSLFEGAGFELSADHSEMLPHQHFLVFVAK